MSSGNKISGDPDRGNNLPKISIVIPMRNEGKHIARCLESVLNQDYPTELTEIIVVDGGSSDDSVKIVRTLGRKYKEISLMGGPGVNCPAAMNIGIREATGGVISKIDAHGYIPSDFLRTSVGHLFKDPNIKCVGGPINPVAETRTGEANVLARSSIFGVGTGIYSAGHAAQFVNTVQCGVYKRAVFDEVGVFDESLQFGEDEELNWRIRKKGYKIYYTPEIKFFYFSRESFRSLFRQYYNYGRARVKVIRKHPDFFSVKHLIPAIFLTAMTAFGILSPFSNRSLTLFSAAGLSYVLASFAFSARIGVKHHWPYIHLLPISFASLHFGYAMGFIRGILELLMSAKVGMPRR